MKHTKILALVLAFALITTMFAGCGGSATTYSAENPVKISIDEWIGWQSLLDANGGLVTAPDSLNAKNGVYVEYVVMNDASASSAALISGELQGAGYTVNRYAFLQEKFDQAGLAVKMPFITNFSNGGDGIIARSGIVSVNDLVGKKVAEWGEMHMGDAYSYVGCVVGATYPEMGKVLRKIMPKTFILVPGYGAQGGKAADLVPYFNKDGLGAIINSSRGIIAAYKQDKYSKYGSANFAEASRQAVLDMREDINAALAGK